LCTTRTYDSELVSTYGALQMPLTYLLTLYRTQESELSSYRTVIGLQYPGLEKT